MQGKEITKLSHKEFRVISINEIQKTSTKNAWNSVQVSSKSILKEIKISILFIKDTI
jgi:hypothetical protein